MRVGATALLLAAVACGPTEPTPGPTRPTDPGPPPSATEIPVPAPSTDPVPEVAQAVAKAATAVREDPGDIETWSAYADLLAAFGWAREAAVCYRVAERMQPQTFRWPYMRGQVLAELDATEALRDTLRAIELDEGYAPAHVRAGALSIEIGEVDAARERFERACALDDGNLDARLGLGRLELDEGRIPEALTHLGAALALDDSHPEVHEALARALFLAGRKERADEHAALARRHARKVTMLDPRGELKLQPISCDDHVRAGLVRIREGDLAGAHALFARAVEIEPSDRVARENLCLVLANLQRLPEAAEQYTELCTRFPELPDARMRLATVQSALGRVQEALASWRVAATLAPDDPAVQRELLDALVEAEEWTEAQVRLAPMLTPDAEPALRLTWARVLQGLGRGDEALEEVREVVRDRPEGAEPRRRLIRLLLDLGRPAEARAEARGLLERTGDKRDERQLLLPALRAEAAALSAEDPAAAVARYEEALALREDWPPALRGLSWLLATVPDPGLRDPARALELVEPLFTDADTAEPAHFDTRAAAHAAQGDFASAIQDAEEALRRARAAGRAELAERIESRLEGYRAERAYVAGDEDPARER